MMMHIKLVTLILSLSAAAIVNPLPNNPVNTTVASIENYFGNLVQSLVTRRAVNSTELYHSTDGHTQITIQPAGAANLQEILFHPTNQHLVAGNETKLFSNETSEKHLAKIYLVADRSTEHQESTAAQTKSPIAVNQDITETTPKSLVSTTSLQFLKSIPITVVTGTTEADTTLAESSTKVISDRRVNESSSATSFSITNSKPSLEIVTPVNNVANANIASGTTTTVEPESESKEIRDKVKEVEAEPVILTVGV